MDYYDVRRATFIMDQRLFVYVYMMLALPLEGTAQMQSPTPIPTQIGCNQFLSSRDAMFRAAESSLWSMNQSMLIRHATLWEPALSTAPGSPIHPTILTDAQGITLAQDLESLLDVVWKLEMNVDRFLYKSPQHVQQFPHLKVRLDSNSDMGAWACLDKTTIKIAPSLIEALWRNSINRQTSDTVAPDIPSLEAFVEIIRKPRPPVATYADFLANNSSQEHEIEYYQSTLDAYIVAKEASVDYVKALLFVLAHEAAHHWLDRCEFLGSRIRSETRADRYGLLISSTWTGEQFNRAMGRRGCLILEEKEFRLLRQRGVMLKTLTR